MASKRMIAQKIVDSDAFLDMPQSTQNLYFHLNVRADDDGFIDNPKKIMRIVGSNQNDIEILLSKRYLLLFDSGVIVIKHWRLHNTIQKDRYKPTVYQEEYKKLQIKDNGAYTDNKLLVCNDLSPCIQNVNELDTECYIDKVRLDKIRLDKVSKDKRFVIPTVEQIKEYCTERNNKIDAEYFFNYYQSKGWMIGKNKMKDWKSAVRTWEKREKEFTKDTPKHDRHINPGEDDLMERLMKGGK